MSLQDQLTTLERQRLACELSGVLPEYLLKVRATADSLVVIIHTGEKFVYNLTAIQAAVERLAAGLGRFTDEIFRAPLDDAVQPPPEAAPPAPKSKGRPGGKSKVPPPVKGGAP